MQRFLGFLLIAFGIAGVLAQRFAGLHHYIDDAGRYFLGPNTSGTYGSPVGEAVVYLVFYFIGVLGLVLIAIGKRGT